MLVVKIFGGLGNQMFQYAFSEYLKKNNKNVLLDISDFTIHRYHYGFELNKNFNLKYSVATKHQLNSVRVNKNYIITRLLRKLGYNLIKKNEFICEFHSIIVNPVEYNKDIYFEGYWQNVKYLDYIKDDLIHKFKFKNKLHGKNAELEKIIINSESVFIHIRRGDYLKNSKLGGVCDLNYYKSAINYMEKNIPENKLYVIFSDDPEWAKQKFEFLKNKIFVDWNVGENSYIDMHLMSLCKHSIIANSTFSWWSAWLNQNKNKVVVMPKKWFIDENSDRLLIEGSILI